MKDILKVGVVGMGVGEKHAIAYQNHPNTILKSICDFDSAKVKSLKVSYPEINIGTDPNLILEDPELDIVSIASYDDFHLPQILKALENGKHIMSEKPLCLNYDEMLQIYKAQQNYTDLKLSSNLVLRTNSRFRKFRKENDEGKLGEVYFIEGDYFWGRKSKLYGWRANMEFYSIILGAAIHMIDLVMWIVNDRPILVQCLGNNIVTKNSPMKYNSFAVLLLKFKDGLIVKITGNGVCIHPHFHGLKIYGSKKTAIHNLTDAYYLDSSKEGSSSIPITEPYPEKGSREKVIHSFVDYILDDSLKPIVPQQHVYDVMSVCFAAEKAMDTGKSVIIEYLE